ncbi:MAG: hypothetical protein WCF26_18640, partial [Candidatus Sulfotelmatobacter sp.]
LAENAGYSYHGGGGPPYDSRLATQTVAEFYPRRSKPNLDKSEADFFVGAGNTISLPRFSPALCHSHPHWQRTESHKHGFFRSALHMAHDLIHMAFSPTFYCAD